MLTPRQQRPRASCNWDFPDRGVSGTFRVSTRAQIAEREETVVQHLARRLADLELPDNHFLVGVSQIACGGDTLFSRAWRGASGSHSATHFFLSTGLIF